jgi:multidrug efflux pump subunit AcrA (membrane-fusion protein)
VVAQGLVRVEANRRTVTHRDGGTVARILVREGQLVQRGDVLIELEDVRVEASVDVLRAQLSADRLRQSRLEAEAAGRDSWQPAPELLKEFADVPRFADRLAKERATFAARRTNVMAQIDGERAQAQDTRTEIEVRTKERENTRNAVALMREELALNQRLEQEQYVNRARVMGLQRGVSEYESRQFANEAELSQAKQRLGAIEARMRSLRDGLVQQANEELRDVGARVSDAEQRLASSQDDRLRQTVWPRSGPPGQPAHQHARLGDRAARAHRRHRSLGCAAAGRSALAAGRGDRGPQGHAGRAQAAHGQRALRALVPATVVDVSADALTDERSGRPS